jgi:hypothetical protein
VGSTTLCCRPAAPSEGLQLEARVNLDHMRQKNKSLFAFVKLSASGDSAHSTFSYSFPFSFPLEVAREVRVTDILFARREKCFSSIPI